MDTAVIQRQYDDVIAPNYDRDPQNLTARSLEHALAQLRDAGLFNFSPGMPPLRALDLGMGTGSFLSQVVSRSYREVQPCGLDLSANMIQVAEAKIPGLRAEVDDAARFDEHFTGLTFELISTHFLTGFVSVETLAPLIFERLDPGGLWSFVGSSSQAWPQLRKTAESQLVRLLFKGRSLSLDDMIVPQDATALMQSLQHSGFDVITCRTFEPQLSFPDLDAFMQFAYDGGWLTPFVESLGLQHCGRALRGLLNRFVFPIVDNHQILLALARRPEA